MQKMGRPTLGEVDPQLVKKIIKLYRVYKSTNRVAKQFGLHHATVKKYLVAAGEPLHPTGKRYSYAKKTTTKNKMLNIVEKYGAELPRDYKRIGKLIGKSPGTVAEAFYRMKKLIQENLEDIPPLKLLPKPGVKCTAKLRDENGLHKVILFLNNDIESYEYKIDKFAQFVLLMVTMKGSSNEYEIIIKNPQLFKEEIIKYYLENYNEEGA